MPGFSDFLEVQTRTAWGRTLNEFAAFCVPAPGSRVLDVGCGPGLLPAVFAGAGCRALGIDLDHGLLSKRLAPGLAQADAYHLPFPGGCFDLLTATNVLFLFSDPGRALREWARLLRPNGRLCLLNPSERLTLDSARAIAEKRGLEGTARDSLLGWARNAESHARWTESETRHLLDAAGLELRESSLRIGPGFARFSSSGLGSSAPKIM